MVFILFINTLESLHVLLACTHVLYTFLAGCSYVKVFSAVTMDCKESLVSFGYYKFNLE